MREKKKIEIEDLIHKLDLTPAMYKNAVEKYEELKRTIKSIDESITFYPQGSFVLGTTVRPYRDQRERNYDLDAICLFNIIATEGKQKDVRNRLETVLENSQYQSKLNFDDRCITVEYADYGSIGFSIDVAPSAIATDITKQEMIIKGCPVQYVDTAIEVAEVKKDSSDKWISSNPQAYYKWFEEINRPFTEENKIQRLKKVYENNKFLYSSLEDVPEYYNKSSLQMAIQLLKRARDVHFSKLGKQKEELKPISAIISTIVLDTAKNNLIPYTEDVLDVIEIVINELKTYAKYQEISEDNFKSIYASKVTISKRGSKWEMFNPVNPKDNLVDMWNVHPESAKLFFDWIATLDRTLIQIFDENNVEYERNIGNILGQGVVQEYYKLPSIPIVNRGPSPWKM